MASKVDTYEGVKASRTLAPIIVWLALSGIWGSTWLFIKLGLRDLPPITFAGMRFVIAALVLALMIAIRRVELPRERRDWLFMAGTGTLAFAINFGLLFWGEQHVSSGLAALLQATIPLFGMALAHLYLEHERMTLAKLGGIVLGLAGVGVIFSDQLGVEGPQAFRGSVAIVLGALAVAYSNVLIKARGGHMDTAVLAAGQMMFGLIPLLIVGLAKEGNPLAFHWTRLAVISLFYLALVGSVMAYLLYYWLIRHMDVTNTMLIALVTPIIALVLGVIVMGEHLTWRVIAGGACILVGIALIVLRRKRTGG